MTVRKYKLMLSLDSGSRNVKRFKIRNVLVGDNSERSGGSNVERLQTMTSNSSVKKTISSFFWTFLHEWPCIKELAF